MSKKAKNATRVALFLLLMLLCNGFVVVVVVVVVIVVNARRPKETKLLGNTKKNLNKENSGKIFLETKTSSNFHLSCF